MTKAIEQAAQKNYSRGSSLEQNVVAKFFNPTGDGTWYLMNQDPQDPSYCWGITKIHREIERGSFSLDELRAFRGRFGLGIERDLWFKPMPAKELWDKLQGGAHI